MRRARKRLGQHFLHDPIVIGKIITAIAPRRRDRIVEIGGGRGALTAPLLERAGRLHVIEIDSLLADLLDERFHGSASLTVHPADALKFDYSKLADDGVPLRIVGNLPYNVSTPLLFRLLEFRTHVVDMHVMLQKEVVDRMTAQPGGKDYGRLTVMLAAWTDIEACFDIGPGAFSPPPKVRSTFVRIRPRPAPSFTVRDEESFARLVARLFSMRRKTLARALRGQLTGAQIEAAGIDPGARPETLRPADFARLAELEGPP
ncbi:16S rRNA (adenine(1518)-N(6)/adenine(1519)-N(6))-dimethyltransferase RsmA [Candidatus Rariloculus sp.]|uniref:16S rRNA (adenine(1518)-N(6)/adenine(1519)-N(6))- dimethyltransferase RsmA n=1 Tax=Candidatus Rariloculus sp. TaxID=3101265 RepID=UPI003D116225